MFRLSSGKLTGMVVSTFLFSLYIAPFFNLGGIQPDLTVLLLLFYSFRVDWKRAPLLALILGLIKDLLSLRYFGIEIFSLGLSTILLSYLIGKIQREDPAIIVVCSILFSLFYETLASASFVYLSGSSSLFHSLARSFCISLYTLLVLPLIFPLFQALAQGGFWRLPRRGFS